MPELDMHPDVLAAIRGATRGRARVVRKAAYVTNLVEASGGNPRFGMDDSLGSFQQRPSQGWGTAAQVMDPRYAARQFVRRAAQIHRQHPDWNSAQIAQAVQRSAYPDRYAAHDVQAAGQRLSRPGGPAGSTDLTFQGPQQTDVSLQSHTIPGQSFAAERDQERRSLLLGGHLTMDRLLEYKRTINSMKDVPERKVLGDLRVDRKQRPDIKVRGRDVGSPQITGGGSIYEVFYDPLGEYWDSGEVHRGSIGDHTDHVHVSGDPQLLRRLGGVAQGMKLTVGENSMFTGKRVTGGHVEGSFHYEDKAIDVSGSPAAMRKFARIVMREARRGRGR